MIKLFAALAAGLFFCYESASAQQAMQSTIGVGDLLDDAAAVLRASGIEFHEGGLALSKPKDDDSAFGMCVIDKHRTWAVLYYSKATKAIKRIGVITIPQQKHVRMEEIWSEAKSLTIHDDGSYSIHFLPAKPPIDPAEKPRSVYPRAKSN